MTMHIVFMVSKYTIYVLADFWDQIPLRSKLDAHENEKSVKRKRRSKTRKTSTANVLKGPTQKSRKQFSSKTKELKVSAKKGKILTVLYNRLKVKVQSLEPLTPTWYWTCDVEKNTPNTR